MNMMSVLLGATGLLLLAALVLSFGSMNAQTGSSASQDEIEQLRNEIELLNAAEQELAFLRSRDSLAGSVASTPSSLTAGEAAMANVAVEEANRIAELAAENAALKGENDELRGEVENAEKKVDVYKDEAGFIAQRDIEKHDLDQRRARVIREALLIARVIEWSKDDGFAVITVERPENVQESSVLAVRRNSGIIGQLRVSGIYESGQAVADPIPATFIGGGIDLQAGDELIIPPL